MLTSSESPYELLCQDPALPVRGRAALRWVLDDLISHTDDQQIDIWMRCLRLLRDAPQPTAITTPLLAVTGEHDVVSRPPECRALAPLSPGSVFATIKEADHFVFLTRTREHLEVTRRFLLDQPLEDLPYLAALEKFPHLARQQPSCRGASGHMPNDQTVRLRCPIHGMPGTHPG
ncbi:alpha/beta fold hydrolase [Streptomyces sp. NPDC058701]|uniref:alpha/beta fold hydrolase n=1 Tax=Streptomyces sp. NPDC058701 TaxID=3346608 RepID=UPI0036649868